MKLAVAEVVRLPLPAGRGNPTAEISRFPPLLTANHYAHPLPPAVAGPLRPGHPRRGPAADRPDRRRGDARPLGPLGLESHRPHEPGPLGQGHGPADQRRAGLCRQLAQGPGGVRDLLQSGDGGHAQHVQDRRRRSRRPALPRHQLRSRLQRRQGKDLAALGPPRRGQPPVLAGRDPLRRRGRAVEGGRVRLATGQRRRRARADPDARAAGPHAPADDPAGDAGRSRRGPGRAAGREPQPRRVLRQRAVPLRRVRGLHGRVLPGQVRGLRPRLPARRGGPGPRRALAGELPGHGRAAPRLGQGDARRGGNDRQNRRALATQKSRQRGPGPGPARDLDARAARRAYVRPAGLRGRAARARRSPPATSRAGGRRKRRRSAAA